MATPEEISSLLSSQFHKNLRTSVKRPGILQIHAPFFHEDGDMFDIYLDFRDQGFRLCDFGKTLMKLSYSFDLDTENKHRIFTEILAENQVDYNDETGNIYLNTTPESLCQSLLHFAQAIGKVSKMDILRRENVTNLFVELVDDFIRVELSEFNPLKDSQPVPGRDDLEVPYTFDIRPYPVFLFPVRNVAQNRLAAFIFLEFQRLELKFKGCVVHDDMESLPAKDRKRITSAADKQFFSIDDFRSHSKNYLRRECA